MLCYLVPIHINSITGFPYTRPQPIPQASFSKCTTADSLQSPKHPVTIAQLTVYTVTKSTSTNCKADSLHTVKTHTVTIAQLTVYTHEVKKQGKCLIVLTPMCTQY